MAELHVRQLTTVVALFLASVVGRESVGETVYDSLFIVDGSLGVGAREAGQTVRLAGIARQVTRVDLALGGNTLAEFRLRFYLLDGAGGTPGTMFWESALQTYPWEPPFYNYKTFGIDVPGIVVPDAFAWAVKGYDVNSSVSLLTSNPPTVGQNADTWLLNSQGMWVSFVFTRVLGARITAIPEPSTCLLAVLGVTPLFIRRRRCDCAK